MHNWQDVIKYWPLLVVLVNGALGWLFWSAKKHFASNKEMTDLAASLSSRGKELGEDLDELRKEADKRLDALEREVAVLKSRLEALPTKESVHRLEVAIGRVEGDLQGLAATLEATTRGIERNIHLLLRCQMEPE